jgi:Sigma-70, region 4
MTLEQELIDIFASSPFQRNRDILIGYYGWADGRQHTLTEIGVRFGITRERVRQICAKLTKRAKHAAIAAPTMDRALALISNRLPCPATQLEAELAEQGLTAMCMSIENLAVGARLLNRPVPFQVVNVQSGDEGRLVVQPDQIQTVAAAVDVAKRDVYFHGLTTVEQTRRAISRAKKGVDSIGAKRSAGRKPVAGHSGKLDTSSLSRLVRQTVPLIDGFCWLDESAGWFHLRPVQCHGLPKVIDKVLAVAGTVTAVQLRTALRRNRRLWKEPPPEDVLVEFCRRMPQVRIEGDRIISDPPRDWKKSLIGVEARLVAMLKAHGPVMDRGVMEDLCVGGGMNRFSFHAFVSWSPVIAQFGHSIYGLLGADVSAEEVERLLAQRRASRTNHRVLDRHGWTDDGRVWLSYRLSKAASTYAVITIPAALREVVNGRFQFIGSDGQPIGTLATKDGRAWGLGAFLRKHDAQIGDHIVLTLDLEKRTAVVTWDERGKGIGD